MKSLSSYDPPGKKGKAGASVVQDIEAGNLGLRLLDAPTIKWNKSHPRRKRYKPTKVFTLGNHENRITRKLEAEPWDDATTLKSLETRDWLVIPFLAPIKIDDILYAHYFCRSANGKVRQTTRGQASAKVQVQREHMSCTAGHSQGLDAHMQPVGDGKRHRGLIAGSFYMHDEKYMSHQGQNHWRGIVMKHEIRDQGNYDMMEVSLEYLLRAYT